MLIICICLPLWTDKHPNWEANSDKQTEYMKLIRNSTDDIKEKKREEKVIKNLCNITQVFE